MNDPRVDEAIASGRVPPEITPAFLNESQDAPAVVGIVLVTVLTVLVVGCRLFSRAFLVKRFGLDDTIALLSLASRPPEPNSASASLTWPGLCQITFIPFVGICIELIRLGAGRHFAYTLYVFDLEWLQWTQVLDSVAHVIYSTALLLCRVSGLAFYSRLCSLHNRWRVALKATLGLLIAGYLAQVLLIVFHCQPITGTWPQWPPGKNPDAEKYVCVEWAVVYVTNSAISLFCDCLLFGMPIAMLRSLEMPSSRKVQLGCILLPGVGVVGLSVGRLSLVVLSQLEMEMSSSYAYLAMVAVEVSEVGGTLIALSVPGVKPLVDKYVMRKSGETGSIGSEGTALRDMKRRQYSKLGGEKEKEVSVSCRTLH